MNKAEKQLIKEQNIELIILYFRYRNIFNMGFQSYKVFKNMIVYITNIQRRTYIRNLFETMLSREIFTVKYINKSRFYIFNPYNLNHEFIGYNRNEENNFIINFN